MAMSEQESRVAFALGCSAAYLLVMAWIEHERAKDPKRSTTTIVAEIVGIVGGVIGIIVLLKK
ncbi:hypothetical protein OG948_15060 [Embleya sp. NBC_00888]|uniref:hypothetical protein n=1 Tax=Embleya sp. NBC_00888 TaxID=2975960 RepID=UPI003863FA36|nr:hypothetical protein OG948_15060 [Embleya sp. NBC_00888]